MQQVVNDIKTELKPLNLTRGVFEKLDSVPTKVMPIAQYIFVERCILHIMECTA
jgi:hypothetical protein